MPLKTELLRNHRVLLLAYTDPLLLEDVIAGFDAYADAYAKATKTVHSITDVSQVSRMPSNLLSLLARGSKSPLRNPIAGYFVVVTTSAFVRTLISAVARLMPKTKIVVTDTINHAWAEIEAILASEPDSAQSSTP